MSIGEHISTHRQGRYVYEIFVVGSGMAWEWRVARLLSSAAAIHGPAVAEGRARSRGEAIASAQAACRDAMEQYRTTDWTS
jgi:hypothetical protein